tara:strand:+ start:102 stop:635 length:534 start_codon:yes stop_codon:yes gene_type:complete
MKKSICILALSLSVILSFSISEAHGPSRQKVNQTIEINKNLDQVWKIISDFNNFKWNSEIKDLTSSGNDVGAERTINFKNGSKIKQKLEKIDAERKMISWRIVETDNKFLPVNSYAAKIFLKSKESAITQVIYKAGFYRGFMGNDPPEELNDENSKKKVSEFIKKSLDGLKQIAEKN